MQSLINNIIQSLVKKEKSTLDDTNSAAHAVLQQPRKRRWKSRFSIMVRTSQREHTRQQECKKLLELLEVMLISIQRAINQP